MKQRFYLITFFAFLVIVIVLFFLSDWPQSDQPTLEKPKLTSENVDIFNPKNDNYDGNTNKTDSNSKDTDSNNELKKDVNYWKNKLQGCPKESESFERLKEPILEIIKNPKVSLENEKVMLRNWHIRHNDKKTYRLQLINDATNDGKLKYQLKYFVETDEGLPWPVPIPKKDQMNPTNEVIESYLNQGEVVFSETFKELEENGHRLNWLEAQGTLLDLNWCQLK